MNKFSANRVSEKDDAFPVPESDVAMFRDTSCAKMNQNFLFTKKKQQREREQKLLNTRLQYIYFSLLLTRKNIILNFYYYKFFVYKRETFLIKYNLTIPLNNDDMKHDIIKPTRIPFLLYRLNENSSNYTVGILLKNGKEIDKNISFLSNINR